MSHRERIARIQLFRFLPARALDRLTASFITRRLKPNEVILNADDEVKGLMLIAEGDVAVFTRGFTTLITTLKEGATLGEMSLVESSSRASAAVRAGEAGAVLLEWSHAVIDQTIFSDEMLSLHFFKGASILLSQRLRATNEMVNEKISVVRTAVNEILSSNNMLGKVRSIRGSIDGFGGDIVGALVAIVPKLEAFAAAHPSIDMSELDQIKQQITKVTIEDGQALDRISQQIGLILQVLENVQRVAMGQEAQEIKGDRALFDKQAAGGEFFF